MDWKYSWLVRSASCCLYSCFKCNKIIFQPSSCFNRCCESHKNHLLQLLPLQPGDYLHRRVSLQETPMDICVIVTPDNQPRPCSFTWIFFKIYTTMLMVDVKGTVFWCDIMVLSLSSNEFIGSLSRFFTHPLCVEIQRNYHLKTSLFILEDYLFWKSWHFNVLLLFPWGCMYINVFQWHNKNMWNNFSLATPCLFGCSTGHDGSCSCHHNHSCASWYCSYDECLLVIWGSGDGL